MTDRHQRTATAVTESTTVVIQAVKLPAIFAAVVMATIWSVNKYDDIGDKHDMDNRDLMLLIESNQRAIAANQQAIVITQSQAEQAGADRLYGRDFDSWLRLFRTANPTLMINIPSRDGSISP
jgi:hypothetical protein